MTSAPALPQSLTAFVLIAAASLSLTQGAPKNPPAQPFAEIAERGSARIVYWGAGGQSGGEVAVNWGKPVWKDVYDAAIDKQAGVRWRLGKDFWTNLDTNMDLKFGDVSLAAGHYYLALERKPDQGFVLWFLDPVEIRDLHLDAFQVGQTKGGIAVPMTHRAVELKMEKLALRLDVDANRKNGGNFVIHFGKHELTTPFTMTPGS